MFLYYLEHVLISSVTQNEESEPGGALDVCTAEKTSQQNMFMGTQLDQLNQQDQLGQLSSAGQEHCYVSCYHVSMTSVTLLKNLQFNMENK